MEENVANYYSQKKKEKKINKIKNNFYNSNHFRYDRFGQTANTEIK